MAKKQPDIMSALDSFKLIDSTGIHPVTDLKKIKGVAFLHIGKTGGTSVQDYAKSVCETDKSASLLILRHATRLPLIAEAFPKLRFAFFVRDPIERTISSFNCRMVNGRPRYNDRWSAEEAVTFSFFEDHDSFLKALIRGDERMKSAAIYGLKSISHLRRNYIYHFEKTQFIHRNQARFAFVGDSQHIAEQFDAFCKAVNLPAPEVSGVEVPHAHKSKVKSRFEGTNTDRQALRIAFAREYKIYNRLKTLAEEIAQK